MRFVKLNCLQSNLKFLRRIHDKKITHFKPIKSLIFKERYLTKCKGNLVKSNILQNCLKIPTKNFHTTKPNQALPPILWIFIRSVLKITAILTGRGLRIWWTRLPPNEKLRILAKLRENRPKVWIGSFTFGGVVSFYYVSHLVEDPITKRRKFLLFSETQILQIAIMEKDFILKRLETKISKSGSDYDKVKKISQHIIQSNKKFPGTEKKWEVFIINDPDKKNAFVLPSGHIFIYTGMLRMVNNDDQLAVILAHEIAHALLNHSAEVISRTHFMEMLLLLPIFLIWALLPDFIALSSHLLMEMISTLVFSLPMNRQMEVEADVVGLSMAARACYDPRQAVEFWKMMEEQGEGEAVEWLSTHPRYRTRYKVLQRRMPEALGIRDKNCK